jgi:protein TonB
MQELRRLYRRYATIALLIAVSAHLVAIGCYYALGILFPAEELPVTMRKITIWQIPSPPSIMDAGAQVQARIASALAKVTPGIPVPVPDPEVNPDQTIASQREIFDSPNPGAGEVAGTGAAGGNPGLAIPDDDPPEFLAVERPPVPVKAVTPEYPEIARRAGMEGTVWVKVLVDKNGKVRKALVVKSDNDIFNEPAVHAALGFLFTPAMMNNGPVAVWAAMPFRFKLNK